LIEHVRKVLRCVCHSCSKLLAPRDETAKNRINLIKNRKLRFNAVFKVADGVKECSQADGGCGHKQPKYSKKGLSIELELQDQEIDQGRDRKQKLLPEDAQQILENISAEDMFTLGFDPENCRPSWMIIKVLAVAPPPVRPSVAMTNTLRQEDDLTFAYQQIVKHNN